MAIPTESIGSIPRPQSLIDTIVSFHAGQASRETLDAAYAEALKDTIHRLEETGSPVLTDGEQTKPSFATYPLSGLKNLASDGAVIPFADGHTRQLPRLTAGPFRYGVHAAEYLKAAKAYTPKPVKQAVIAASALSLLYPATGTDRLHRGPALAQTRSYGRSSAQLRRSQQPGARALHTPRAAPHRRTRLPRRRSGLDP